MRGEQFHCEELGRELREVSGSPPRRCVSFQDVLRGGRTCYVVTVGFEVFQGLCSKVRCPGLMLVQ